MTDKTVVSVRIAPRKNGDYMKGAKVILAWNGQSRTSTVGTRFASFNGDMRGQSVEVVVNGQSVRMLDIPVFTPTGVATISLETTIPATAVPPTTSAQPTREEPERQSKEIPGNGRGGRGKLAGLFRRRRREVQPEAGGKETTEIDEAEELDDTAREPVVRVVPWKGIVGVITALVVIAGLVFLGFNAPEGTRALDIPSGIGTGGGITIATWLIITTSIVATVYALADRLFRRQGQDIVAAFIALILFQISGANILQGLFPEALGQYGTQTIVLTASMFLLYGFAIAGTPDFTTPGAFWLINAAIAVTTGKFGPISNWLEADGKLYTFAGLLQGLNKGVDSKFTLLIISAVLFATLHFLLDISGLLTKGEDPAEKWGSFGLAALIVAAYYITTASHWLSPVAALIVVSAGGAILAEIGKMGVGFLFSEQDQILGPGAKAILRTKWDGAALSVTTILLVALIFGYL